MPPVSEVWSRSVTARKKSASPDPGHVMQMVLSTLWMHAQHSTAHRLSRRDVSRQELELRCERCGHNRVLAERWLGNQPKTLVVHVTRFGGLGGAHGPAAAELPSKTAPGPSAVKDRSPIVIGDTLDVGRLCMGLREEAPSSHEARVRKRRSSSIRFIGLGQRWPVVVGTRIVGINSCFWCRIFPTGSQLAPYSMCLEKHGWTMLVADAAPPRVLPSLAASLISPKTAR